MDMGVDVPAWKAVQNKLLRGGFESSKALPVLGNAIRKSEREGIESFNRVMANNATPPTPVLDDAGRVIRWETNPVNATGTDAINALSDRFDQSYKALYDGRGIPMDDTFTQETADILANTQNYFPRITDEVSGAFRQVDDVLRRGTESTTTTSPILNQSGSPFTNTTLGRQTTSPSAVKQAMDALDARIKSAYLRGDGDTGQTLSALRDQVSDLRTRGLPPEVAGELGSVNKAYASFKQLQKANSSLGAQSADVLTPRQVLGAVKANDRSPNRSAFTKGKALNQQTVLDADRVLGSRLPEVGPGTAEKLIPLMMLSSGGLGGLATGAPIHGLALGALAMGATTKAGQKYLLGQQPGQATARAVGNRFLSPALRQFGAVEGAKYGREEQ